MLLEERGARRYERFDDRLMMIPWLLLESFGYRQLTVVWRLRGLIGFIARSPRLGRYDARRIRRPKAGFRGVMAREDR